MDLSLSTRGEGSLPLPLADACHTDECFASRAARHIYGCLTPPKGQDSVFIFSDQRKVGEDTRWSKEQPTQTSSDPSAGRTAAWRGMEIEAQESHPSSGLQTVRAALFEKVVEEDRVQDSTKSWPRRRVSLRENGGCLVTSPYRQSVSPFSPRRVEHLFDTVQLVGERRAVSESVPSAQLEDKAVTLRSRRSEGNRPARAEPVEERPAQVQGDFSSAQRREPASQHEQGPRYLRVGALQKWNTAEVDRGGEVEKERQRERERKEEEKERQREAERRMQIDVEREKPRERDREREEVAAPKRLKMLEADEQPTKPRTTYFALTGQNQEVLFHGDEGTEREDMVVPFDDFSVMSGQWGSQGKVQRNPFEKSTQGQEQEEELMERKQTQERESGMAWDRQTGMEEMEIEKQKQVELEKVRELEREKERQREKPRQLEIERQKQLEYERKREMEKQRELERERKNELERQRELERELERRRQESERQREFEKERQRQLDLERQNKLERQRVEELERIKEMERRELFEKQKQNERAREQLHELEKQRLREKMERGDQEKMRPVARQQESERQRILERQRRENQERGVLDSLPLRLKVLDRDSVGDQHSRGSPHSPGARWKQPSPRAGDRYRHGIPDIDSFRSQTQTQPSPTREVFPIAGIKVSDPGSGVRSDTPERKGSCRMAPVGAVGRPSPVWAPSQQELWEQRLGINEESVDMPVAGPEPPRKPANKPILEHLLHRQLDRATAPILVAERRWSGMPSEPSFPRRVPHSPASPMEQTWFPQDSEPQGHRVEARGQRRSQGSQELNRMRSRSVTRRSAPSESAVEGTLSRMRSRSVSRRSAPSESAVEGTLSRMRSRSVTRRSAPSESAVEGTLSRMSSRTAHRERGRQSWEQLKQRVDGEEEGWDIDRLVQETDSQYGTWETGLATDDGLTPATPTSDSNLSPSPRKPILPHTPGEHAPPSDLDTPDGFSPSVQPEMQLLPFPVASTILLDSSALRSRVQLSKMRGPRSRPSRVARQTAALSVHPEGQTSPTEDWRSRDYSDNIECSKQEDSDSEEQERGADPHSAASQPQRVALFPGMDPSALKAQLKKRGDSDNQTDRTTPSPFLPRASHVLTPSVGQEYGEKDSPQWLRELKSKKRLSQYENDS